MRQLRIELVVGVRTHPGSTCEPGTDFCPAYGIGLRGLSIAGGAWGVHALSVAYVS
jgi:hypothetical protein